MIHEVRMLLFRFKVIDIFMVNHLYRLEYICVRVGEGCEFVELATIFD